MHWFDYAPSPIWDTAQGTVAKRDTPCRGVTKRDTLLGVSLLMTPLNLKMLRMLRAKINRIYLFFALVLLPLDKVFALGKAKINKIYFVFFSRFITFAVDYAEWEE